MIPVSRGLICTAAFLFSLAALGCGNNSTKAAKTRDTGPQKPNSNAADTGKPSTGQDVYAANDCKKCHSTDPSAGKGKAPNLGTIGKTRNVEWLIAHIKNPKTHSPMSKMPAYEGKISDPDLKLLAEYLAALK